MRNIVLSCVGLISLNKKVISLVDDNGAVKVKEENLNIIIRRFIVIV